jgi:uncharacterized protein
LADPRGFLRRFPQGAILDEVQRAPDLLSWLQGVVDQAGAMGAWVLTGSQQLNFLAGVTQSLAGRVGRVELLPLSGRELLTAPQLPDTLEQAIWLGGYPAVHVRDVAPADFFGNYVATYIERDVRQLVAVRDLTLFQRFVRLCAARSGQLLNLAALGADAGISAVTAREWLTVLEASYLVLRLQPFHRNLGKRLVKTPKLYFLDTGLLAWLLGIRGPEALDTHAVRGPLFETWVVAELTKQRLNAGEPANLFFWRDHIGHEVDLVLETPQGLQAVEVKSGRTFAADWPDAALRWQKLAGEDTLPPWIIYGGEGHYTRQGCRVTGWREALKSPH